eukprot:jgi/Mesvir1/16855/Mv15742-RA.1
MAEANNAGSSSAAVVELKRQLQALRGALEEQTNIMDKFCETPRTIMAKLERSQARAAAAEAGLTEQRTQLAGHRLRIVALELQLQDVQGPVTAAVEVEVEDEV